MDTALASVRESHILMHGVVLLVLLGGSALLSAIEVAFFSLTPKQIESVHRRNPKAAGRIQELLQRPQELLATILLVNTLVNLSFFMLGLHVVSEHLAAVHMPVPITLLGTFLGTFGVAVVGEMVPKVHARQHSVRYAIATVYGMSWLVWLCMPLAKVMVWLGGLLPAWTVRKRERASVEQLGSAIELTMAGADLYRAKDFLHRAVRLGTAPVARIMCPKERVVSLRVGMSLAQVCAIVQKCRHARLPVYDAAQEHIVGVVQLQDILASVQDATRSWEDSLHPAVKIVATKTVGSLLHDLQRYNARMAIVIDAKGDLQGLVTVNDIAYRAFPKTAEI